MWYLYFMYWLYKQLMMVFHNFYFFFYCQVLSSSFRVFSQSGYDMVPFMIYGWILLNKRGFTKFTILFWIFTLTTNLFGTILFLVENYGIEDDASSHLELPLLSRPSKLCFPERRAWRLQCLDTPTCNYLNRRTIYCWCILI